MENSKECTKCQMTKETENLNKFLASKETELVGKTSQQWNAHDQTASMVNPTIFTEQLITIFKFFPKERGGGI